MSRPYLAELRFLPNIKEPFVIWEKCVKAQEDWNLRQSSFEIEKMKEYRKKMAVQHIWMTNIFEDTLPKGLSKKRVEEVLTQAYEDVADLMIQSRSISEPGLRQLVQHLEAFKHLCQRSKDSKSLPDLSEDVIKKAHQIMMQGLRNEQGLTINAGVYRRRAVCAGDHIFPSYECIPDSMERIIREYNKRVSESHDQYELASWLHFNIVSLHPFEDGNGRISRLLWCYSLMRDGLPFPTVLTSGEKHSQKHLILCLNLDRDLFVSNNPHLTTLTVVSVHQGWKDYFKN